MRQYLKIDGKPTLVEVTEGEMGTPVITPVESTRQIEAENRALRTAVVRLMMSRSMDEMAMTNLAVAMGPLSVYGMDLVVTEQPGEGWLFRLDGTR